MFYPNQKFDLGPMNLLFSLFGISKLLRIVMYNCTFQLKSHTKAGAVKMKRGEQIWVSQSQVMFFSMNFGKIILYQHIIALSHHLHGTFQWEGSNVSKTPNTFKTEMTNACNCPPDTCAQQCKMWGNQIRKHRLTAISSG